MDHRLRHRSTSEAWAETESRVYEPAWPLLLLVGTVFVLMGIFMPIHAGPRAHSWAWLIAILFRGIPLLFGGIALVVLSGRLIWPARIRHATPDVLPDVPNEPVQTEGAIVHGRLTHELVETDQGWELRPASRLWRDDKRFMLGFGVPVGVAFIAMLTRQFRNPAADLLTRVFHSEVADLSWVISAICAILVTMLCFGTVLLLFWLVLRSSYRRLSTLTVPRNGGEMHLESPEPPKSDMGAAIRGLLAGSTSRRREVIPSTSLVAVQLCPWKCVVGLRGHRSSSWGVQGLLVLAPAEEGGYRRIPILLTQDQARAARLMRKLAKALHVPFLFGADAAGWKAEMQRAKTRPPLRTGGTIS